MQIVICQILGRTQRRADKCHHISAIQSHDTNRWRCADPEQASTHTVHTYGCGVPDGLTEDLSK
jgi:hypothetical protein